MEEGVQADNSFEQSHQGLSSISTSPSSRKWQCNIIFSCKILLNLQSMLLSLTKLQIEDQVLKFFISANIPFRQLENAHFRELVSWINVNGHPARSPSRKIIRARLTSHAILAKENLKILLKSNKSKISLALDCWTSRSNFGFLGLSLYK